jgi:ribosome maturation factor RimP
MIKVELKSKLKIEKQEKVKVNIIKREEKRINILINEKTEPIQTMGKMSKTYIYYKVQP